MYVYIKSSTLNPIVFYGSSLLFAFGARLIYICMYINVCIHQKLNAKPYCVLRELAPVCFRRWSNMWVCI